VREGRRREFASFAAFSDPARRVAIPDPNDAATFERSRPRPDAQRGAARHAFYRHLLDLRRQHITPRLKGARALGADDIGPAAVVARWRMGDGAALTLACNLGADPCPFARPPGEIIFEKPDGAATHADLAGTTTIALLETSGG